MIVWVVDDDASIRWVLDKALGRAGMQARGFATAEALLGALESDQPDVVITDIRMPDMDGLTLLERLRTRLPELPVIVITAHSDLDAAVSAYSGGAFEYLPKPFDVDAAVELVRRSAGLADEPEQSAPTKRPYPRLLGQAPRMQTLFRAIGRLSRSSMPVLITGESGTGKELVARALHQHSPRSERPFIALNTSAIPRDLLESELFGHERGAFTGADAQRRGRFEQAHGGTLFLDEIGDMSTQLQTRLLRVLAESEFYRVGGQSAIRVDVRVIAATHRALELEVERGRFRSDLYHRLNVVRLDVPPLRERREDIRLLLQHYLDVAAAEIGVPTKTLSAPAEAALVAFDWPGNVRQLVNLCRQVTVLAPGRVIETPDLRGLGDQVSGASPDTGWSALLRNWAERALQAGEEGVLTNAQRELERTLIAVALEQSGGRRQEAARLLGCGRNTLTRKIREHGLGN